MSNYEGMGKEHWRSFIPGLNDYLKQVENHIKENEQDNLPHNKENIYILMESKTDLDSLIKEIEDLINDYDNLTGEEKRNRDLDMCSLVVNTYSSVDTNIKHVILVRLQDKTENFWNSLIKRLFRR